MKQLLRKLRNYKKKNRICEPQTNNKMRRFLAVRGIGRTIRKPTSNALNAVRGTGQRFGKRMFSERRDDDDDNIFGHLDIHNYPPNKMNTVFNICPQGYQMVVERFGKFSSVKNPGWFLAIPVIDQIKYVVDMRELTIKINPQSTITRDNVSVDIGGALYVKITDPSKACYGARRPLIAITQHAQSSMRSAIGQVDLDELLHNRRVLNNELRSSLVEASEPWGMQVMRYEITGIHPDPRVSNAMDQQAVAERDRRQEVLLAEAKKKSTILVSEGQKQEFINTSEGQKQEKILLAEGHKQRVVLESEADKTKQINEAQGRAQSILLEAEAVAQALSVISEQIGTPEGRDAMNFKLAENYLAMIGESMAKSSTNTVFLPKNVGDVPDLVAKGMGIIGAMKNDH